MESGPVGVELSRPIAAGKRQGGQFPSARRQQLAQVDQGLAGDGEALEGLRRRAAVMGEALAR